MTGNREQGELMQTAEAAMLYSRKHEIFLDLIPKLVFEIDENGVIRYVNREIEHYGYSKEDVIGAEILSLIHPDDLEQADRRKRKDLTAEQYLEKGIRKGYSINTRRSSFERITRGLELLFRTKDGAYKKLKFDAGGMVIMDKSVPQYELIEEHSRKLKLDAFAVRDREKYIGTFVFGDDISEQRRMEAELRASKAELQGQKRLLEENNRALRELLGQMEEVRTKGRKGLAESLQRVVLPLVEKIQKSSAPKERKYLQMLQASLQDLITPAQPGTALGGHGLTAREMEICQMIRHGFSTPLISRVLSISPSTVERHRNNVRTKFGLANKKIGLRNFLKNL